MSGAAHFEGWLTGEARPEEVVAIPAVAVASIRESIYQGLARTAEEFAELTTIFGHSIDPTKHLRLRRDVEAACALLDEIGWSSAGRATKCEVELPRHLVALLEAARGALGDVEDALGDVKSGLETDACKAIASIDRLHAVRDFTREVVSEYRALLRAGSTATTEVIAIARLVDADRDLPG